MYKILIKKRNTSRNLFEPYMVERSADMDNDSGESDGEPTTSVMLTSTKAGRETTEYETDDLTELAEKYKELLSEYTTSELKLIEELDADVIVEIVDN